MTEKVAVSQSESELPFVIDEDGPDAVHDDSLPKTRGKRELTWWRLAMITFVYTCSGPGGLEQAIKAGGPLPAIIGLFAVPVFYVMPQIFVVSELGSMMPTSAGTVAWVDRAFGETAGFYNAWIFAATNMVDVAIYPVMFGDYLTSTFFDNPSYTVTMTFRLLGVVGGSLLSLFSPKALSNLSTIGMVIVVGFCTIIFFASTPNIKPAQQWSRVEGDVDYSLLGSSLLWLFTGWTALSAFAGETKHPKVLFQGMSSALVVDIIMYLFAIIAALTACGNDAWEDGEFVTAFNRVIPGIGPYFGVGVILTGIALFLSAMMAYSRLVWGMAEMGWAPSILRRQLSTGAPHYSVLLHAAVASILVWFDFGLIVKIEYTAAASSYIITYLAFIKLRYSEPNTPRPYTIPGGMPFAWLITITKIIIMGATMIAGLMDWRIAAATVGLNVVVLVGYVLFARSATQKGSARVPDGKGGAAWRNAINDDSRNPEDSDVLQDD